MDKTIINFGAGPATLPKELLDEAAKALLNYENSGLSILEIPHRESPLFEAILAESRQLVLGLTGLNADEYEVLWLQGGGRLQFAMIPMNFLDAEGRAGYIDSGFWADDAQKHAAQFGNTLTLASSKSNRYRSLPQLPKDIPSELRYVHITTNNTIYGTQFREIPNYSVPLIADMSSDIFSEQRNYSRFDMFYAVAQKNLGAAGVTMVVIKKSLLSKTVRNLAPILDYQQQALQQSVLNTPPVFSIYISLLVLRWLQRQGIAQLEQENIAKANALYDEIDRNSLLSPIVEKNDRSRMNVVFNAQSVEMETELVMYCQRNGVVGIKGHRSVGGLRVSLYNAISMEQVEGFIRLLQLFEQEKLK